MEVDLLFYIFLLLLSPSLGSKSDLIAQQPKSWISNENFTTMLTLSFPFSKCCNVYLSDSIQEVEVLFNQFQHLYPYEYLLKRKTYECQGYFLLGPADKDIVKALEKVPSVISTTEILIIINGNVESNSSIFNVSLYRNANANIVSLSGAWTLSENYLRPRIFRKLDRYEEMMKDYNIINFQGRKLNVCSFYRPPFTYLNRTANRTIDGVTKEVFLLDDELERDGIEMKIFLLLAEKLNFTWTIAKPDGPYRYGRRVNKTEWNGGLVQMLRERKVDIAFGGIWLTEDHNAFVNLTEPWYQLFIHFLVPRPRPTSSFWALTRPFSVEAWLLLVVALLLDSLYVYIRARIDPRYPKRFRHYLTTLIELMGRLLGTSIPKNVANIKLHMLLWQTAGWLIITAYCSSLAARLASSEYEERVDTIQQFLDANLWWGRKGQIPPFHDYFDLTDPYSAQLPARYHYVENDSVTHAFIKRGNYAIIGKIVDTSFFPEDDISNDDLKQYRVMRQMVGQFYSCFAVQPWLLTHVNEKMLWLKESGITLLHLRDVIRRRASFNLHEVLIEHDGNDGTTRVLELTPLGAGFSMLLVGLLLSTFVFYLELKHASKSGSIRDVLRIIERKRKLINVRTSTKLGSKSTKIYCYDHQKRLKFIKSKSHSWHYIS